MAPLSTRVTTCAAAEPHVHNRIRRTGACLGLTSAVLVLTGCALPWSSNSTADEPTVRPNELADVGGRPCPKNLPIGDDPSGHGFGIEEVANADPILLEPEEAWVCRYDAYEISPTPNGGAVYGWRRAGQLSAVATADLPELQQALSDLEPGERNRDCPADLGPRWMVAYSHGGDLTAVVADDFGCRDVRLTDNPHITPPGADDQDGTVGGVLDGGAAVLQAIGVGRTS